MSREIRETLDETIDRVAASLTVVPADPGFADRLAPRLDARHRTTPVWLVGAMAAATIALAIVLVDRADERSSRSQSQARLTPIPSRPLDAVSVLRVADVGAEVGKAMPVAVVAADEGPFEAHSTISALAPPESLSLGDLALRQIAIPAVTIERLEIGTLELAALGNLEDSKE